MINSYSPRAWITIFTLLTVSRVWGDNNYFNSSFGHSDCENSLYRNGSMQLSGTNTNLRKLREICDFRQKKEDSDSMNYLNMLYSEMTETKKNSDFTMDDFTECIVDPPQVELHFHKKVPNCASEFNITKILELVDDDKRQRKCPWYSCCCGNKKNGNTYEGSAGTSNLQTHVNSTNTIEEIQTNLAVKFPSNNKTIKSEQFNLAKINEKKIDDKQKTRLTNQQRLANQLAQRMKSNASRLTPGRVSLIESKKKIPLIKGLTPFKSASPNIHTKKVNMRGNPGAKLPHKVTDVKPQIMGQPLMTKEHGKHLSNKQPFIDWSNGDHGSDYSRHHQYDSPD